MKSRQTFIVTKSGTGKDGNEYSVLAAIKEGTSKEGKDYSFINNDNTFSLPQFIRAGTFFEYDMTPVAPQK